MSIYYLKALQGEEPFASWYGLSARQKKLELHPERIPADCPHDCLRCPKCLFGECGLFTDDEDKKFYEED